MKKYLALLLIFLVLVFSCLQALAAAGSCTVTRVSAGSPNYYKTTFDCTCDTSTGAVPTATSPYIFGWIFMELVTYGATPPTNGFTLTLSDANSIDVTGNGLAALTTSGPQQFKISRYVHGPLTLAGSGQSVASATFTLTIYDYVER